jgi:hypothetical protein
MIYIIFVVNCIFNIKDISLYVIQISELTSIAYSTSIYWYIILCLAKLLIILNHIRVVWVEPSTLLSTGCVFLCLVIVSVAVVAQCDYTSISVTLRGEGLVGWSLGIIYPGVREGDTLTILIIMCHNTSVGIKPNTLCLFFKGGSWWGVTDSSYVLV